MSDAFKTVGVGVVEHLGDSPCGPPALSWMPHILFWELRGLLDGACHRRRAEQQRRCLQTPRGEGRGSSGIVQYADGRGPQPIRPRRGPATIKLGAVLRDIEDPCTHVFALDPAARRMPMRSVEFGAFATAGSSRAVLGMRQTDDEPGTPEIRFASQVAMDEWKPVVPLLRGAVFTAAVLRLAGGLRRRGPRSAGIHWLRQPDDRIGASAGERHGHRR